MKNKLTLKKLLRLTKRFEDAKPGKNGFIINDFYKPKTAHEPTRRK